MAKKIKVEQDEGMTDLDSMLSVHLAELLTKGASEAGVDIDAMEDEDYQMIFGGMPTDGDDE
jgi:hypothetical protein